jgi:hypothetical protein
MIAHCDLDLLGYKKNNQPALPRLFTYVVEGYGSQAVRIPQKNGMLSSQAQLDLAGKRSIECANHIQKSSLGS